MAEWMRRPSIRPLTEDGAVLVRAKFGDTGPMRALMWVLGQLERLSLGHQLTDGCRKRALAKDNRLKDEVLWRFRAGVILDWYIVAWVLIELVLLTVGVLELPSFLVVAIVTYRLAEVTHVFANGVLFDRRRSQKRGVVDYNVLSIPRSVVQAVVLLFETVMCFAVFFYCVRDHFTQLDGRVGALDFSMRAMTTVGPEGSATGYYRLIADIEPFVGLLFVAIVLARFVNATPKFVDVARYVDQIAGDGAWEQPPNESDS
jgi:hypothetical protein